MSNSGRIDGGAARPRALWVSHELTILLGAAALGETAAPERMVALAFDAETGEVLFIRDPDLHILPAPARIVLLLDAAVFERLECRFPQTVANGQFRLPGELWPAAQAALACEAPGEAGDLYCAAKAIELLCEAVRLLETGVLQPIVTDISLSQADRQRITSARRLIDEHWRDRLTLDEIASRVGVNREKLTRGFRTLFDCTIAEALAERRLGEASLMLMNTDLPVSSVGYASGYLSNASFSRAFARRFGVTPTDYRAGRQAAA